MQHDPAGAQEIESFGIASLVERAVGAFHPSAPRLDDQGERGHAATADAAEKVISDLGHRRNLQALCRAAQLRSGRFGWRERNSGSAWSRRRRACRRRWRRGARRWPSACYPDRTPEIVFHPQCFASHGHFAGDDDTRARAFLDVANDESYDAVWFARGGYGSCRVVEAVIGAADGGVAAQEPIWATAMPVRCWPRCIGPDSRTWRTVRWRRTSCATGATWRLGVRWPG